MSIAIPSPAQLKAHLYFAEWCDYLGLRQREVAKAIGLTETHLSRIADNKFKRRPNKTTLEAIRDYFRTVDPAIRIQDLWRNPFDRGVHVDAEGVRWVDLSDALKREDLLIYGERRDAEFRKEIEQYVKFLISRRQNRTDEP